MNKVEFHAHRDSYDESTYAVVTASVENDALRTEGAFLDALIGALSRWVRETQTGRDAWEESSEDFNVGDLSNYHGDPSLTPILADVGIMDLRVKVYSADRSTWTFDTVLIEENDDE